MNYLKIFIVMTCLVGTSVYADIYEWTDENGTRHFTNYAPPSDAKVIMKTQEVPYDAEADRARMELERQQRLDLARQEIAEKEAELEQREAEAQRRLAEANRQADETLQKAEDLLNAAGSYANSYRSGGYYGYYSGYYPYPTPYYNSWYYRGKHDGIYLNRPYQKYYDKDRHGINHFSRPNHTLRPGANSITRNDPHFPALDESRLRSFGVRNFERGQFGRAGSGLRK